jgi:cell division protein FtsB
MRLILKLIIGVVVLSLAAVGGYVAWHVADSAKSAKKAARQIEKTAKTVEDVAKKTDEIKKGWRKAKEFGRRASRAAKAAKDKWGKDSKEEKK